MTLEQINYFIASVETGSFSGAGNRLFVSHSSVSRGVSALEEELGVRLLTRGRRMLACTEAGEVFYRQGKALLQQARQLRESVAPFQQQRKLQLVCVGIYAPHFFDLCRIFQRTHPAIKLVMEQGDQHFAEEKLRSGAADMTLTFSYSLPPEGSYDTLVLEQGSFCALVSPRHELADREYLTGEELMARRDILGENPFHTTERSRRRNSTQDVQSILLQIKTGDGITLLPEHTAAEFGQGCVQIPSRGEMTNYQLVLVWDRENTSPALNEAVAFFREHLS